MELFGYSGFAMGSSAEPGNDGLITFVDAGARPGTGNAFYRVWVSNGLETTEGLHTHAEIEGVRQALAEGNFETMQAFAALEVQAEDLLAHEADIIQLRNRIDTRIDADGVMALEVSRGRGGIWYTYLSLAPLTAASRIVYNAGLVDFFNYEPEGGGGLRQALDYLFTYCLDPGAWPHYEGDDLINPPAPDTFYGALYEAMAGIYNDAAYAAWVADARPVMNDWHHFAWAVPTLMRAPAP